MEKIQTLLQASAKLFQHLTEIPQSEQRDEYIETLHQLLDQRGEIIEKLEQDYFQIDQLNKSHVMLVELDKGIRDRLQKVMRSIQEDLKIIQNTKKSEKQYTDPYSNVQVMDGRYYDKKN